MGSGYDQVTPLLALILPGAEFTEDCGHAFVTIFNIIYIECPSVDNSYPFNFPKSKLK